MHQNSPFWDQKLKNFLGRGTPFPDPSPSGEGVGEHPLQGVGGTPRPHAPPHRHLWRLNPTPRKNLTNPALLSSLLRVGALRVGGTAVRVAIAVEKLLRRRPQKKYVDDRVSRIILASVVNASSRRRRGLPWPRSTACLQRLAGTSPVSLRRWSFQRARGPPGRRLQSGPSGRPDDTATGKWRASGARARWVSWANVGRILTNDVIWWRQW